MAQESANDRQPSPDEPRSLLLQRRIMALLTPLCAESAVDSQADFFSDLALNAAQLSVFCRALRELEPAFNTVSLTDLQAHSSAQSLAVFLLQRGEPARPPLSSRAEPDTGYQRFFCAAAQISFYVLAAALLAQLCAIALPWLYASDGFTPLLLRAAASASAWVFASTALAVLAKWILVGRWKAQRVPLWGSAYLKLWVLRRLINCSPLGWFSGTPVYNGYLRLLGAKIGAGAVLHFDTLPLCSDLLLVGEAVVVERGTRLIDYKVQAGQLQTGSCELGAKCRVGADSSLELNTRVGAGIELPTGTVLSEGERLADRPTSTATPAAPQQRLRALVFSLALLACAFVLPATLLTALLSSAAHSLAATTSFGAPFSAVWLLQCLAVTLTAGCALLLLSIISSVWLPRVLRPALTAGQSIQRHSARHLAYLLNRYLSNALPLTRLLGDSVFVDDYLRAMGFRHQAQRRSGLQFSLHIENDVPHLSEVGAGAQCGDHLRLLNTRETPDTITLLRNQLPAGVSIPAHSTLTPAHTLSEGDLLASRASAPCSPHAFGPSHWLGAPAMALASAERLASDNEVMVPAKNRHNLGSIWMYMASLYVSMAIVVMVLLSIKFQFADRAEVWFFSAGLGAASLIAWQVLVEYLASGDNKYRCMSVYEPAYWRFERYKKLRSGLLDKLFLGTPLRAGLLRARGASVGSQLYDDGLSCAYYPALRIADNCHINRGAHCHNLQRHGEQISFGAISVQDAVDLGPYSYLQANTELRTGAVLGSAAVLMPGETLAAGSHWSGNPAAPH